ncbi:2-octaprenyl-6-methoxyphenol hydroxylase [Serratia symbiotica]|nr:2-octaprenyl-6-methoxyphenol hydroxylase [Serratia symbiotica]
MSVIIVGGGMAGTTLALAISVLTQGSIAVDLVEAHRQDEHRNLGCDARVIALSQGTCQQLIRIGVWSALSDCATAITHVHVSDRGHFGFVDFDAQDFKIAALGQVVELYAAGQRLFRLLEQAGSVTLHCPARVVDVVRSVDQVEVILDNSKRISGQLLVAADGSHSALGQACNIQWQKSDYHQIAIIANITTSEDPGGRAFERFTRNGPLAILPISQRRCSLVWCHVRAQQEQLDVLDDQSFMNALQRAFGWRLGRILKTGKRHSYPVSLLTANRHVSHRVALVGNAAQTLHPIAGQGFNLGLRDVISLAEILSDAGCHDEDLGGYQLLHRYEQRRKQDQKATIAMTDGLIRLFANCDCSLVGVRNLGLLAMSSLPGMRNALARRALGWVDR